VVERARDLRRRQRPRPNGVGFRCSNAPALWPGPRRRRAAQTRRKGGGSCWSAGVVRGSPPLPPKPSSVGMRRARRSQAVSCTARARRSIRPWSASTVSVASAAVTARSSNKRHHTSRTTPVLSRVPGLRHRLPRPAAEPIGTSVSAIFFSAVAVVSGVILRFAWSRRQSCSVQRPRERITSPHTRGRTRSADAAISFFVSELQRLTVAIAGCR